ncbi:hypothetical protein TNCV_1914341 [Trichonephila clavipes]|nr:hypothetical protein TNCV_1914341 [Trichonephila clavipes]
MKNQAVHRHQPLRVVIVEVTVIEWNGLCPAKVPHLLETKNPPFFLGADRQCRYHVEWSATPQRLRGERRVTRCIHVVYLLPLIQRWLLALLPNLLEREIEKSPLLLDLPS